MHWNDGWGGWFFMGLFMLIAWGAVVCAIVYVTRDRRRRPDARPEEPRSMDILEERFARGEIDEQEFRERRKALTGS
jgi:putative membrane protein